ncbi:MAG: hydrogenase formation protein HypD [Campylobacterales bacterium]|nr:hydrogenase formation protein HypD [Campylobacterales bacterium]
MNEHLELKELIDGFREPKVIKKLSQILNQKAEKLDKNINIMEVCGGHTHTIMKYGLNQLMPKNISFAHGPGCPVCVMPKLKIDHAISLAKIDDVILCTLGDMIKVKGSLETLANVRSQGHDVRFVYSPLDCIKIATQNPQKKVIYFAIGFETTTPMSAALIESCLKMDIKNLYFCINHVSVPEPVEAILDTHEAQIDALIAPSHVSVITGAKIYQPIVDRFNIPIVVGGFEPIDVMQSVILIVEQFLNKQPKLEIEYSRAVNSDGNLKAQQLCEKYFEKCDFNFRGLGVIKNGGLRLKERFDFLDGYKIFDKFLSKTDVADDKLCICADILRAVKKPTDCKLFGTICKPTNPIGSCMVSSEGACNAYFRYSM